MSEPERIFLYIFSLFRQEVKENDFACVFRHEIEGTKFNDVLVTMSELDFKDLINGLVDWRLISYDETKKSYTTHPLIKGYFESDFDEKNKKLCHKRIYQYFGEYAPEQPETLEEMQPLFEQVYHGCAAGLYDVVLDDVFFEKIYKRNKRYIVINLGARLTALSLLRNFFPEGDFSQMPLVSKKCDQSWLLNDVGLTFLATGRSKEAEKLITKHNEIIIELKDWANASIGYQNLADLQFRTGELERALSSATKALDAVEKATFNLFGWMILCSKAYLAWILHLMGKGEEAGKWFRQADELSGKIYGIRIGGLYGIFYADFLIIMKKIDEAFELTKQNLEISQRNNWSDEISRCHRCLGAIKRLTGKHNEAKIHLQKALEIARKVCMPSLEIEALLESSRLHLDMERQENAIRAAKEAQKICARTCFKLYEPETEIVLSKAYMALKDVEQAKNIAHSTYEKAVGMNYRWAEGDAAHLLGEIYLKMGDKVEAREWIEKAVGCRKEILDPGVKESERILESL
jgi:tetratricopeptide (TPR) repeat protein